MAGARSLAAALAAALPFVAVLAPRISAPDRPRAATPRDSGCAVCHPAAAKALTYSVHAGLRSAPGTKDRACTVCHGEQAEHVASAIDPTLPLVRPGAVRADACAACHPGRHLAVAEGAHPWHAQLDRVPEPSVREPAVPAVPPPPIHELRDLPPFGYDLGAAATFGWRFVDVLGSHERYDTDVHLDDGPRLTDLELRADARGDALIDRARLTLTGLGDPWMRLRGELADDGGTGLKGRFARDSFVYRARGDFHRVDVRAQEWGFDLRVPLAEHTEATASFTRRLQNGFWLTNRIGNRNVNPQSTVTGVRSPRDHDADLWEVGVLTRVSGVQVRAGVEYRAHADVDGFHYERPAPSNPGAIESEDFVSSSTLRGPGAHLRLNDDDGAWRWSLGARVLELERRVRGDGFARGFD
ncbi:MAG TPA: hypothetical protein VK081_04125, partial [Planctomycetota bacterium]|nr:hypothetical protein [Planctomycetota bacterium]